MTVHNGSVLQVSLPSLLFSFEDLSKAWLALYPLQDPFVLNTLVRWKSPSANDPMELRATSTHTEETEAEDGMDVLMRLSRLMDDLCHEYTTTKFHEFEMACTQLQVLSMPSGSSVQDHAAFALNLFNVMTRHVALLVRHFPQDPRAQACAKIWPKDLTSLHADFLANISYNIGGKNMTLAALQTSLYGTDNIEGFLEKRTGGFDKNVIPAVESADGLLTDGGANKRPGGWMRRFLSSLFASCKRESAVVESNHQKPRNSTPQEPSSKGIGAGRQQYCYKAPIVKGTPKLLMACTWGTASSPTNISTVYPHKLARAMDKAMRSYIQEAVKISLEDGRVTLPVLLAWYAWDFASTTTEEEEVDRREQSPPVSVHQKKMGTNFPEADAVLEQIMPFMSPEQLREMEAIKNQVGHLSVEFADDSSFDWTPGRLGLANGSGVDQDTMTAMEQHNQEDATPALIVTPSSSNTTTPAVSPSSSFHNSSPSKNDMNAVVDFDADEWSVAEGSVYTTPYKVVDPPDVSAPPPEKRENHPMTNGTTMFGDAHGSSFQTFQRGSSSNKPPPTNRPSVTVAAAAWATPPPSLGRRISSGHLAAPPRTSLKRPQTSVGDVAFSAPHRQNPLPVEQIDDDGQSYISTITEATHLRNPHFKYF